MKRKKKKKKAEILPVILVQILKWIKIWPFWNFTVFTGRMSEHSCSAQFPYCYILLTENIHSCISKCNICTPCCLMTSGLHSENKQTGTELHIQDNKYKKTIPKKYLCVQPKSCYKLICEWFQSLEQSGICQDWQVSLLCPLHWHLLAFLSSEIFR